MELTPIDFIKQFPIVRFDKGSLLEAEGAHSETIYAIQTGFVKVSTSDSSGSQKLVWIAGRYDIVPTESFFSKTATIDFYYTAIGDVSAYAVPKTQMLAHAQTNIAFMTEIARGMSGHYDDMLSRLRSVEQTKAKHKIASSLTNLAKRFSADDKVDLYKIGLDLTQQDIADMVGLTRETTSIELTKLRDEKCISYSRTKFVLHISKLESLL